MLGEPKDSAPEPILEGQAWDRFDALGRPSPNDRYLREADNRSRRLASVRQAVPEDMLKFMAGWLFGDLGPQRDSERGSLCTRRTGLKRTAAMPFLKHR
jgi:hypothetical protein